MNDLESVETLRLAMERVEQRAVYDTRTIENLVRRAHRAAVAAGWYDPPKTDGEALLLIHSEISEATEEWRKGTPPVYVEDADGHPILWSEGMDKKPEGMLIELADAVLRIADLCGAKDWDLEAAIELKLAYNLTRSHRHGGKRA